MRVAARIIQLKNELGEDMTPANRSKNEKTWTTVDYMRKQDIMAAHPTEFTKIQARMSGIGYVGMQKNARHLSKINVLEKSIAKLQQ